MDLTWFADCLIAHALQKQMHKSPSSERFVGDSDILGDGRGKKSGGERVVFHNVCVV